MIVKYEENILPSLTHFFKTKIVPLAGARSTWYTRDAVTCTTLERDANDMILELDPGFPREASTKNMIINMVGKFKQQPRET